ncbi:MAG: ATP-dependent Clp protease ATP-binding subunit [Candidatus Berkelbacteria bacterium]
MSNHEIFDKFSQNARKILISAQKIAQSMGTALGSEHILLALAITPKTLAQSILREQMVGLDQIRLIVSLHHFTKEPAPGMSAEAKDALRAAAKVAAEYGHDQIDTEHLLLGIISEEKFNANEVVDRIGTDPSVIMDQIRGFFEEMEEFDENPKTDSGETSFNFQMPTGQPLTEMPIFPPAPPKVSVDSFTTDLTDLARKGKIDPVIGRDKEIERAIQILARRTKNNPVLVGEPGVGKTAIVEGIAKRIIEGKVPSQFLNKKLVLLDLPLLIAGTMYRGQFEERIKKVLDEIIENGQTILFIDEIHTIVGAGSAEGSLDVANILKPALSKGKLRLIGATTFTEYRKFIEKDSALERRMQKVTVNEPSEEDTIKILHGIKPNFETYHGVKISDEAIRAAVELSVRYINDRFLPDKAIDLIDEASSAWKIKNQKVDDVLKVKLNQKLEQIKREKEKEVELENFAKAANLRTMEIRLEADLKTMEAAEKLIEQDTIKPEDIARALALWTNIPVENLRLEEKEKFAHLAQNLSKKIVGQTEAVEMIAKSIQRSKTGLSDPNRPIGSFIFLGPTGVGKTELARVLADELFGSRRHLIKIDMSEFMEHHNVSRLVGAPPGYVGFEEAGKLTEEVRQKPYSIILFDEIEKADREVFNLLLQILEDGELTDARGRKVNFRNTIIIMTSNIGMQELNRQAAIGFNNSDENKAENDYEAMKENVLKKLKDSFRPEFLNRLDKILVFKPLTKENIESIAALQLQDLAGRLKKQGISIKFNDSVVKHIAQKGYEPEFGARPIRRMIVDLIETPLAEALMINKFVLGDNVQITLKNDQIVFTKKENERKI